MAEVGDAGVVRERRHGLKLRRQVAGVRHQVAVGGNVARVQRQIERAEAVLAHGGAGRAEVSGADHAVIQLARQHLAALEVVGEQRQCALVPGPVFHHVRGQLHEVPGHAGSGQLAHGNLREREVQQVAELVKHRLDLVVAEQRVAARAGGRHVAAHQTEMRGKTAVFLWPTHPEAVHPGPAALAVAGKPVGVEAGDVRARLVVHLVKLHLVVPDRSLRLGDRDAEDAPGHLEQAGKHAVHRKIGAQLLFVQGVQGHSLLFGPVGAVPGREGRRVRPGLGVVKRLQLGVFALEGRAGSGGQVFLELRGPLAASGHAVFEQKVGVVAVAQQLGFFAPQRQNTRQQRAVVAALADTHTVVGAVQFLAQRPVVGVLDHRNKGRHVQGQAMKTGVVTVLYQGGLLHPLRHACQPVRADNQFVGRHAVHAVAAVLTGDLAQLDVQRSEPLLLALRQLRAATAKSVEADLQETGAHRVEGFGLVASSVGFQGRVQPSVHAQVGVKGGDRRKRGLLGGPPLVVGHHLVEVADDGPGGIESLREGVEAVQKAGESRFGGAAQLLQILPGLRDQDRHGPGHMFRKNAVKGNQKLRVEQRILGVLFPCGDNAASHL